MLYDYVIQDSNTLPFVTNIFAGFMSLCKIPTACNPRSPYYNHSGDDSDR